MLQRRETQLAFPQRLLMTIGAGVLRLLLLFCLGLSMLSGTFWFRSAQTWDIVEIARPENIWVISSAVDRLVIRELIDIEFDPMLRRSASWSYRSVPSRSALDPWEPGVWKLLGIDWGEVTPTRDLPYNGTWVRIKWSTLLFAFAVPPMGWAIWIRTQDRRRRFDVAGYCPKCEFPKQACICGRA